MSRKYTPDADCFDAANAASGQKLNREEIEAAFQRVFDYKERLRAEGNITDMAEKLRTFAEKEAEKTKIAAAMQRRHAALNILVRDRLDQTIASHIEAGLKPAVAIRALIEGTSSNAKNTRNSAGALRLAYEGEFIGGLFAEIERTKPHLKAALRDKRLDADITREMGELKEGGNPGITKNADAVYLAKVLASYQELARTRLNSLGASIGKLDGRAGAQVHDDLKMIAAGKEKWIASVLPKLDVARTFPEVSTPEEIGEAISGIYDTLISGGANKLSAVEQGGRVNPANLAKSLGKSRVLHFKDADAALAYRAEFGYGNTVSGIVSELRNAAKMAALMEQFGPNPEVMVGSIIKATARKIATDPKMSEARKAKLGKGLTLDGGSIRQALDIATGLTSTPVNITGAKIGADIRAVQSMAKLGQALFSSFGDPVTSAIASQFRGSGFFKGLVAQLDGLRRGRSNKELNEIAYLWGEGFDGHVGHITSAAAAVDGPIGRLAALQEFFFKWNGLTWWTDMNRASATRVIAAEMGMRANTAFDGLPPAYRHVLGLHGIEGPQWEAIRQAGVREVNGNAYITPDRIASLPDEVIEPLAADRLKLADVSLKTRQIASRMVDERQAEWVAKRKAKLDAWQTEADARLASFMGGNEIRTEIEKQLATRRIELEKAQIEEARTDLEILSAVRETESANKVGELLSAARDTGKGIEGLQEKADAVVSRLSDKDFRGGKELGIRYQRARSSISRLRKEIADIERKSNKRDRAAMDRVNDTFKARLAELQAFSDKVYTREQQRADALARDVAGHPARRKQIVADVRRNLEVAVRRFVADETSYGVIETDARSQRTSTLGTRPGTVAGEVLRMMMQFKGYPIAFMQRTGGRALYAYRPDAKLSQAGHFGTIIAGLTMAGYMSMTMKDVAKGYWPPRDPTDPKTWGAAFIQGGAAGIYGDFLFGRVNRFGGGLTETAIGPALGQAFDLGELLLKARDATISGDEEVKLADYLNFATQNTPFANLFYVKPAMDFLFLNSMREAASPGFMKRQERKRKSDYGQEKADFLPASLRPFN